MLERMWRNQITHALLLRVNNGAVTVKKYFGLFFKKTKTKTCDYYVAQQLHFWKFIPWKMKTYVHSEIYIYIYIYIYIWTYIYSMLFVITPNWTQSWYLSSGEWLNELCYLHTKKYYSAMKKNKLLIHIEWLFTELFWMKKPSPMIPHT